MKKINYKLVLYAFVLFIIGKSIFNIIFYGDDDTKGFILGFKPIIVGSDTMDPSIRQGSLVVVRKAPKSKIKDRDVVVYKVDDNIIIHRAYIVDGDIRTKADTNKKFDVYSIEDEDLLGYVVLRMNTPIFSPIIDKINNDFDEIDENNTVVYNINKEKIFNKDLFYLHYFYLRA